MPVLGLLLLAPGASARAGQPCPSTLNPPAFAFETCQTVGGGTIASGSRVVSEPLGDTGITCGTNADAFDMFNQDTFDQHATRWYDQKGNLTRRHIYDQHTFGQWSNPLIGAVVPDTQTTIEDDLFAIPGDINSGAATFTGENIYRTARPARRSSSATAGQVTSNVDGNLLESSGRDDFVLAFNENDPTAFDPICAALGG